VPRGKSVMGKHYKLWLTDSVTTMGSVYSPDSILDVLLLFALDISKFK